MTRPTLHLLCGKIAAGKSTLAARLARQENTVLISEDAWLAALFSQEMTSIADYRRCSARLRGIMAPHVTALLSAGLSVVLDFPANTVPTRRWMIQLIGDSGTAHQMHFLDTNQDLCRARMHRRNADGQHPFQVSDEQFDHMSRHFEPPTAAEGFTITRHSITKPQ